MHRAEDDKKVGSGTEDVMEVSSVLAFGSASSLHTFSAMIATDLNWSS